MRWYANSKSYLAFYFFFFFSNSYIFVLLFYVIPFHTTVSLAINRLKQIHEHPLEQLELGGVWVEKEVDLVAVIISTCTLLHAETSVPQSWCAAGLRVIKYKIFLNWDMSTDHEMLQLQLHSSISVLLEVYITWKRNVMWHCLVVRT